MHMLVGTDHCAMVPIPSHHHAFMPYGHMAITPLPRSIHPQVLDKVAERVATGPHKGEYQLKGQYQMRSELRM